MKPKIDFGQDAPGLLRGFAFGGAVTAIAALAIKLIFISGTVVFVVEAGLILVSIYLFGMAALMVYESRIGKIRDRDRTLSQIVWTGNEQVLDIGCGRGLMLLGAAQRLTTGLATGIDLWRAEDQANNSADATLRNAALLGVAGRVNVITADMCRLPFDANSFDIILSAWAVHNLPDQDARKLALAEMTRVLRPGGRIALTDIEGRNAYARELAALGLQDVAVVVLNHVKDRIVSALSFSSFAPFTVFATKRPQT